MTYQLSVNTNVRYAPFSIDLSVKSKVSMQKVILAICLLIAFHVLVLFKILPQTLAAMVTAITAIAVLTIVDQRPSVHEVVGWTNLETLSLIFGILFITSMLCDTGLFELIAVMIYKCTGGHTWFLLTSLFLSTFLLSALLDPFTTLILMTAVAIRLCEAMNIDPKHILIALVIFSNTGSILCYSTFKKYQTTKIEYGQYALHVFPAVLLTFLAAYALWRLKYRDVSWLRFKKPLEVEEVKRELGVWKKSYNSISNYSREEESVKAILERKMATLETLMRRKLYDSKMSIDDYKTTLTELTNSMKKKNKYLLYKSCAVMTAVLVLLLLRNAPLHITSGWTAVLGALCLLVLTDLNSMESLINRIEWSTLLFLASYYIFTKALVKLDLVSYLVHEAQYFITNLDENYSLMIALIFTVWVSALSSSVALPFSAAVMELINEKYDNCSPIIYALSLGACIGVNGSLLGGVSNILSSGIAEHHGFRFSYLDFLKFSNHDVGNDCINGLSTNLSYLA
nr:P protein-like [Parasteatoda tepidariorum]